MMNRRRFLRNLIYTGLAVAGGGSGLYYATAVEPFSVEVVEKQICLPGLHASLNGLRAAQISDLHMGMWISREHLQSVVSLILEQKPDLAFITGDCLTAGGDLNRALADLEAALSGLVAMIPVYAVLGNHDHNQGQFQLRKLFLKLNIELLVNSVQPFTRDGAVLYIAGLDSIQGWPRLSRLVKDFPSDGPAILMAHEPDVADRTALTGKFAFQISGHTHGGQVKFPLLGRLVLPTMGRKYPAGLYQVKDMLLYTNRGIGMFHVPIRINCPPEISLFTFVSS